MLDAMLYDYLKSRIALVPLELSREQQRAAVFAVIDQVEAKLMEMLAHAAVEVTAEAGDDPLTST
jgi:hypothetical protein